MAIAEAWCVTSEEAKLAIAVPTYVSFGKDLLTFNAHRIYGPITYPFLVSSWHTQGQTKWICPPPSQL